MQVMNDVDEESLLDKTLTKKLSDKNSSSSLKKQRSSTADKRDKITRKTSQIPLKQQQQSPKPNFILMNKRIVARKPIQNNFMYQSHDTLSNHISNIRDIKNKDNDKNPKSILDDSIQSIRSIKSMLTQNNFSFIEHDSFQSHFLN